MSNLLKAKVVFVGDSGVGKTSLLLRHEGKEMSSSCSSTLGANFIVSTIRLADRLVELQVWDTAGQERFRSMVPIYMRSARAAFLVFDMTYRPSFMHLEKWIDDLGKWSAQNQFLVILGNKNDLDKVRTVSSEEAAEFASRYNAVYFETSALRNQGLIDAMKYIAQRLSDESHDKKGNREDNSHNELTGVIDVNRSTDTSSPRCTC